MNVSPPLTLEGVIRESGEGWLIDWFEPPESAIDHIRQTLVAVNSRAKERLGDNAPDLSEAAIVEEFRKNPQKVRAIFQVLCGTRTPDMLLMAWRINQGLEIKTVQLGYRKQEEFDLQVVLESPYGDKDETYSSSCIQDFALFRHIGILEVSGRPLFDGFYALRLRDE